MLFRHTLVPLVGIFIAVPALAGIHPRMNVPVPEGSFINSHVETVNELSQEVTLDPAVRKRLAAHFRVSEAQITTYVRRNLVLTRLPKAGYYRVACVGRNGREYWIESRLPAGTPVFAARATGRPILKLACGNPMVASLPSVESAKLAPAQFAANATPMMMPAAIAPGLMPGDTVPPSLVVASNDITPAVVEVSPFLGGFSGPVVNNLGHAFNFFGPVLAAGLAVVVSSKGGGGSTPNVPAVPETSTFISFGLMLLLGGVVVVSHRRKPSAKPLG